MKPIIGIVPMLDEKRDSLWMVPDYMDGIKEVGGIPVIFPLTDDKETIKQLLNTVQGILIPGGHDVNPKRYGETPIEECGDICDELDRMEKEILLQGLEMDIPILGICRGIQFINVCLGGSLYQDLPTQRISCVNHHQIPPYDVPVHEVRINEDSGLFRLLSNKSIQVNSYHHQAIKQMAKGLKCMAESEDGLTEAVEIPGKKFVWAVQWHPESSFRKDENSRKILEEFVRNC